MNKTETQRAVECMREDGYADHEIEAELGVTIEKQNVGQTIKTQTLFCERGQHEWKRESTRGKLPKSCPKHKSILTTEHKEKMQEGKQRKLHTQREKKIRDLIEGKRCGCGIEPTMNDLELRSLYSTHCCKGIGYVCPVLDSVMRNVYTYI